MPLNHNKAREQQTKSTTGDSTKSNLEKSTHAAGSDPDPQQREMLMLMCIQALKEGKSKLEEQVTALEQQLEGAIAEAHEANQKASALQAQQLLMTGAPHTPQPDASQTCPSCHCSEPKSIDLLKWCSHEWHQANPRKRTPHKEHCRTSSPPK